MREARDRVEIERKRENKKREKEGKQLLPEDTFEIDVQNMCTLLFEKIEQSKDLHTKMEQVNRKRVHKEVERRKLMKEIEKEDEDFWKAKHGELLASGHIALQAESHPIDFRNIELLDLEGCMDKKAKNFRSYYVKHKEGDCVY